MKNRIISLATMALFTVAMLPTTLFAQEEREEDKGPIVRYGEVDFFRPYDKRGLHMFETTKDDLNKPYEGRKISIGAGFAQQFQALKNENPGALNNTGTDANALYALAPGFSLAQANLYIDAQLTEGIRLHLANYMASKHHNEFWVKGGYLQIDKFPFKGEFWDNLSQLVTVKAGHMEINYGDAHFRRPDGGHTLYSPFMEGNILDAFATEIAGEVYVQKNGIFGMLGVSNGMIRGHVQEITTRPNDITARNPSIYLKAGIDRQVNEDVRLRLTGSWYHNTGTAGTGLTLYSGDRTGSNYTNVMEQAYTNGTAKALTAMYSSGRFNPLYSGKLDAVMINGFAKIQGFEFFGTAEFANGHSSTQTELRATNQYAAEGIYRFGNNENLYTGLRYNVVNSEQDFGGNIEKVKVDRFAFGAGWFITKNILMKGEYVVQNYTDFPNIDYRHNGKFDGVSFQAVIAF